MVCHILLFSCSISLFFNKIPLALLFCFACNSMIYSFWLLGICVLSILLKTCILNMFRICLLGVYVLSFLSQFLYLNMFCISLWGIYFLWFSLLVPPFPFSPSCFFSYLLVFLLLSACVSFLICLCFFSYLLVFLLLSACVSIVIYLCFYCYLLVFLLLSACVSLIFCCLYVGRHTTCTTAVVQFVPQSSYNVYYGRRILSKSAHSMHY